MMNMGFTYGLPFFNDWFNENVYVQVPRLMFEVFHLSSLNLAFFDHYVRIGLTPTFLPWDINDPLVNLRK